MVQGVAALQRRLEKLVPEAIENRIKQAMGQAAEQVCDDMRRLVPVVSGDLKRSIGWTFGDAPKGTVALASTQSRGLKVTIYAGGGEAFYARWIEFGRKSAPAHPFFYPAYRANKRRIKSQITRALNKALKEQGS